MARVKTGRRHICLDILTPAQSKSSRSSKPSSSHSKAYKDSPRNDNGHHQHHGRGNGTTAPLSFLFVVLEVAAEHAILDSWGNKSPPTQPQAYKKQHASQVMKYDNGVIEAQHPEVYSWWRDEETGQSVGRIRYHDGNGTWYPTEEYKTATVLSCHPLMPIAMVDVDATVYPTTYNDSDGYGAETSRWVPLRFFHPTTEGLRGVSQIMYPYGMERDQEGGDPVPYVAGKGSLQNKLIPSTHHCPLDHPPKSRGLGGELPVLISLMAFSYQYEQGLNRADSVFPGKHGMWRNNKWLGKNAPLGCQLPSSFPIL